jgi:hypothetical protein
VTGADPRGPGTSPQAQTRDAKRGKDLDPKGLEPLGELIPRQPLTQGAAQYQGVMVMRRSLITSIMFNTNPPPGQPARTPSTLTFDTAPPRLHPQTCPTRSLSRPPPAPAPPPAPPGDSRQVTPHHHPPTLVHLTPPETPKPPFSRGEARPSTRAVCAPPHDRRPPDAHQDGARGEQQDQAAQWPTPAGRATQARHQGGSVPVLSGRSDNIPLVLPVRHEAVK